MRAGQPLNQCTAFKELLHSTLRLFVFPQGLWDQGRDSRPSSVYNVVFVVVIHYHCRAAEVLGTLANDFSHLPDVVPHDAQVDGFDGNVIIACESAKLMGSGLLVGHPQPIACRIADPEDSADSRRRRAAE